jgi:predicted dehydrogenase
MKFLIAGLGSIGRRHLQNLLALGETDILLYRTRKSTLPEEGLQSFPVETDLQTALEYKPDAVIVSNPTALHLETALPAARAGCHLFLEKPVSHSWEGIPALQEAVRRSGSRVLVGYQFRFHPGLQCVRRRLLDGAIGRPISVRAHWGEYLPGWHPWEDYRNSYSSRPDLGGGVILTLSHPLDYLRWLFGEVDSLWAFSGRLSDLDIKVEDTAEIGLSFQRGFIGSIHLDYNQRPPEHWLEVIGTQGSLRWDNADGAVRLYRAASQAKEPGGEWETIPFGEEGKPFERNELFLAEMRHFTEVARGEAQPLCSLEDGLRALELALAAQQSAKQGRLIKLESGIEHAF